jgi:hypothetical protein
MGTSLTPQVMQYFCPSWFSGLGQSGLIQQIIYCMNGNVYIVEINWVIDSAID